jgi:single-strand DNA-binding protein
MANEPIVTIVGNLTADPDLRYVQSGVAVAGFTVASTPRTKNQQTGQWEDGEAMFVRCSVWREYAENVAESLAKGMRVVVIGRMTVRTYNDAQGQARQSIEMQVDEIGPSLRYARATVQRTPKNAPQASQDRFSGPQSGHAGNYASAGYNAPQGGTGDPAGNLAQMDYPGEPPF